MFRTGKGEVTGPGLLVWGEPLPGPERIGILCGLGPSSSAGHHHPSSSVTTATAGPQMPSSWRSCSSVRGEICKIKTHIKFQETDLLDLKQR